MKKYEKEIRDLLEQLDGFVPEGNDTKKKGSVAPPDELFAQAARREREQREAERQNVSLRSTEGETPFRSRSNVVEPPRPIPFPTSNPTLLDRLRRTPLGIRMTVGAIIVGVLGIWLYSINALVGQLTVAAAVLIFLWPTIAFFFGRSRTDETTYWRGQPLNYNRPSPWSQIRAKFAPRNTPKTNDRSRSQFPNDDPWNKRRY